MHERPQSRRSAILGLLTKRGRASVEEIATVLRMTPQTIRKDLSALEQENKIVRYHGGATLLAGNEYTSFDARRNVSAAQKARIGAMVARQIPNSASVAINSGTTTAAAAAELRQHSGLRVVTDSVHVADEIRNFSGLEVIVPGGRVRASDGSIVGHSAAEFISQFRFDVAVIGTAAIGHDGALLDYDLSEVSVVRAIIRHARQVILAADSSKFGRAAPVCIANIGEVGLLVTDRSCPEPLRQLCRTSNVRVLEA
ncbi:DeoR/GlpR family DNA-binding transcription regulator [Pseudoruegeria sp. HB172150]|uniref:DeoR/GlpR family DNA-binding transcription regulator n=1 Tax=Pseudoruegeria sp. HB172150 TaxID=2721164 RepID=UPI001557E38A|nr:DeoR/GlpR family DNA-binding transcription regulator [Pseudoruegeria sp. HB172150]